jgi:hypothetical protein
MVFPGGRTKPLITRITKSSSPVFTTWRVACRDNQGGIGGKIQGVAAHGGAACSLKGYPDNLAIVLISGRF